MIALKLAAIGATGIAAQWLAWRLRLPAIVLLLAAGFAMGPATGLIDPVRDFGEVYKPVVGLAVAIILFEGGLTLNFREIRESSQAVQRVIFPGGLMVWIGAALAAHFAGGLDWPAAIVLGAVLVVTGPTVIMPLLRSAKLKQRPASILRWEAIVNDPIGALYAVVAFEVYLVWLGAESAAEAFIGILVAFAFAIGAGFGLGRLLAWAFGHGHVPDYLKAPVLFSAVIALFAISNQLLEESGLLAVTIMGIALANSKLAALGEVRRFKETVTILLVSGLFIVLTAALDWPTIRSIDWRAAAFVALLLFVVRPLAMFAATIGSPLSWQERLLIGWIAPRGIVAVAVIGLFGTLLVNIGVEDGTRMIAYTFAVVVASIVLHGFSLGPLSRRLGLRSTEEPGLLIVGGSRWATALAGKLDEMDVPVRISDPNWNHLSDARFAGIPVHYGEILSEHAHHHLDLNRYGALLAASDNDAYNALVCTDFGPDIGRTNIFQIGDMKQQSERQAMSFTLGGRQLFEPGLDLFELNRRMREGWTFQSTRLTDEFTHERFVETRARDTRVILWRKPGGRLVFSAASGNQKPQKNDVILSFAPPRPKKDVPAVTDAKPQPDLPDAQAP
ncbi:MAG: sodium:proton antiporter [Roseitalea porphyridii]|uniref:cation:proton antiporter n=1 Tax=Roseitalea porphyridii TaxID=1852022 RepID=UPI0032EFCF8E